VKTMAAFEARCRPRGRGRSLLGCSDERGGQTTAVRIFTTLLEPTAAMPRSPVSMWSGRESDQGEIGLAARTWRSTSTDRPENLEMIGRSITYRTGRKAGATNYSFSSTDDAAGGCEDLLGRHAAAPGLAPPRALLMLFLDERPPVSITSRRQVWGMISSLVSEG